MLLQVEGKCMPQVPTLETDRLFIRPFTLEDLLYVHQLLDIELSAAEFGAEGSMTLEDRQRWLQWTVLGYDELAKLYQPPYGERAVVLREGGAIVGVCGYVPCLDAFEQLAVLRPSDEVTEGGYNSTEFGLFYAVSPRYQRRGYATEAANALIAYAFTQLRLHRVIATTTYDNAASIEVMRQLGMSIEKNPFSTPPWLQVVGILRNAAK
jgi:ribosomal-protein-alanine N-acetyltransferase